MTARAKKCTNCGSEKVLKDVIVVDHGEDHMRTNLTLEECERPKARIFKRWHAADINADACENCGHVMLFANPAKITHLKEVREFAETGRLSG